MRGLLIIERFILESMGSESLHIEEIQKRTSLKRDMLRNILEQLVSIQIMSKQENYYSLNHANKQNIIEMINGTDSVRDELKELFSTFVNEFYTQEKRNISLNIKKLQLTNLEYGILQNHLKNLKDFCASITNGKSHNVTKQKVIFWGEGEYFNLARGSLLA